MGEIRQNVWVLMSMLKFDVSKGVCIRLNGMVSPLLWDSSTVLKMIFKSHEKNK